MRQALQQIEETTGRRFFGDDGDLIKVQRSDGAGIDALFAVCSAPELLRVAVASLSRNLSGEAALSGVQSTSAVADPVMSLDDAFYRSNGTLDLGKLAVPATAGGPEVVVLCGGTDGGARRSILELAETLIESWAPLDADEQPILIFAGNSDLRSQIQAAVDNSFNLRTVDNVHPQLDEANPAALQNTIEELYVQRKLKRAPGYSQLNEWSATEIAPSVRSLTVIAQFLAVEHGLDLLIADIGGRTSTLVASLSENLYRTVRANPGTARTTDAVLGEDKNARSSLSPRSTALGAGEGPAGETKKEELETSLVRERLKLTLTQAQERWPQRAFPGRAALLPAVDLVIGTGGPFYDAGDYGTAALILLDGLEPWGVTNLAVDALGLLPSLGTLAAPQPLAAVQILEHDAFVTLGSVVAPVGCTQPGEPAVRIRVEPEAGDVVEREVRFGEIQTIPLSPGEKARLELRPTRRFDIGLGVRGQGAVTKVEGGALGLIVDARGRPLVLPDDPTERRERTTEWASALSLWERE